MSLVGATGIEPVTPTMSMRTIPSHQNPRSANQNLNPHLTTVGADRCQWIRVGWKDRGKLCVLVDLLHRHLLYFGLNLETCEQHLQICQLPFQRINFGKL